MFSHTWHAFVECFPALGTRIFSGVLGTACLSLSRYENDSNLFTNNWAVF